MHRLSVAQQMQNKSGTLMRTITGHRLLSTSHDCEKTSRPITQSPYIKRLSFGQSYCSCSAEDWSSKLKTGTFIRPTPRTLLQLLPRLNVCLYDSTVLMFRSLHRSRSYSEPWLAVHNVTPNGYHHTRRYQYVY